MRGPGRRSGPDMGQLLLLPGCLSERDWQVLSFARTHELGRRSEVAVRAQFGWTLTRYFQVLNAMLDRVEVADADPELVGRLRDLREARRRARSTGATAQ